MVLPENTTRTKRKQLVCQVSNAELPYTKFAETKKVDDLERTDM